MIREIEIEGFKSIERLKLELGRVTVLIGENGCGKSNILEAIAFAGAAHADRLEHEFLASRGIRSTDPRLMRPAFPSAVPGQMRVKIRTQGRTPLAISFTEDESSTIPTWSFFLSFLNPDGAVTHAAPEVDALIQGVAERVAAKLSLGGLATDSAMESLLKRLAKQRVIDDLGGEIKRFLVFSPENSALRAFQREGQILPIGINGEGLFAHLRALERAGKREVLAALNESLELIDWFSGFEIPADLGAGEHRLSIRDRYITADAPLDQRSANEGFLFLLFYYTLLLSPDTPRFFAIDNIDASLNPRLCARLMSDVVALTKQQDRQVVVTTHNPAVLDGLDLTDDEQRLVVVSRTPGGATRVRRVRAPEPIEGAPSLRLSEAFLRGFLGGLPDNF